MSGHSKWHQIKHKKAITDHKKAKLFGRLAREVIIAARDQPDPERNAALRDVIGRARAANFPQANIDRLLARESAHAVQELVYEGFGPGGSMLIITTLTDSPNRTVAELKTLLKKEGGSLGGVGSVRWQFELVATIVTTAPPQSEREATELALIEAGAQDITTIDDQWHIRAQPEQRNALLTILQQQRLPVVAVAVEYAVQPNYILTTASATEHTQVTQLVTALEEHTDVVHVTTNLPPA